MRGQHRVAYCVIIFLMIAVALLMRRNNSSVEKTIKLENKKYQDTMSKLIRKKVPYDDKRLVNALHMYYIQPPSLLPYNLSKPEIRNPSPGQTQFVDEYLNHKQNGFFVDSGAYDGEHISNSLFLERYRNWTGVLIEPNNATYKSLMAKHRKAYALNACLSKKKVSSIETFYTGELAVLGKVVSSSRQMNDEREKYIKVQCYPLYTVLLAVGRLEVDYFSLDVEGAERSVLDTIPWDKVNVKIISIEHNKWKGGKQNLKDYMETKGYKFVKLINVKGARDLIFAKKNFMN